MKPLYVILMVVLIVALAFWGGRCTSPKPVPAAPYPLLPDPVMIPGDTVHHHHWHTVPVEDTTWRAEYRALRDSLGNVETTAVHLAEPFAQTGEWKYERPDLDFWIAGKTRAIALPLSRTVLVSPTVDSLHLPKPQPPQVIVDERTAWYWYPVAGVAIVGSTYILYDRIHK